MLQWINKKRNKKGFTLVELVLVIAILGILTAIAIPKLGSSRETAKVRTHNANVRILKSAAAMYLADNPDATSDQGEINVKEYIDGGMPKPNYNASGVAAGESVNFIVTLESGDIKVVPDEMKIDGKIVAPVTQ